MIDAIVWGTHLFGKCDVVPGLFFVATEFHHLYMIPIFPEQTCLVISERDEQYIYFPIRRSIKSWLYAWSRTFFWFASALATIFTGIALLDPIAGGMMGRTRMLLLWALCIGILAFLMIYPRRRLPRYTRAAELATIAGLDNQAWAALNTLYGRDVTYRPLAKGPLNFS